MDYLLKSKIKNRSGQLTLNSRTSRIKLLGRWCQQKIYWGWFLGLLLAITACTPPTPPPSPTPWPGSTPTPTPQTTFTPAPEATLPPLPTPTPSPTAIPAGLPAATPINVWVNLPPAQLALLEEDVAAFQSEFSQYTVELQQYSTPQEFMTPLMANQLAFDVVLASPVLLGNLWAAGQIAPMEDFFSPGFINNFAAVTLAGASQEEAIWGLPDTAGFHLLLFYNKDLVDTPPASTSQLLELAQTLSQGSQWGLGVNRYDPLWLTPWLVPNGSWLTDQSGRPTLNTPAMESALTLYLSWQGRLAGVPPAETYNELRAKFLDGDLAMMIDGEWAIGELANTDEIDWGVALLPQVDQAQESQPAVPLVLARYWAISPAATQTNALASTEFLTFITRPERQLIWTARLGLLPTRREALDDPAIINNPTLRVSAAQMQAGQAVPLGTNTNALLDAMRDPLRQVIDGSLTPQEAAAQMQANAER